MIAAVASSQAQQAVAQSEAVLELDEVVVTAQRRSENIQNVPITVQALTTETLENLKVNTIDEFVKFLPNVQAASVGPTHGNFSIRGLSIGGAVLRVQERITRCVATTVDPTTGISDAQREEISRYTHQGRAFGPPAFQRQVRRELVAETRLRKRGRPAGRRAGTSIK